MLANNGDAVRWDYKKLQDNFRKFSCSHVEILTALERAFLIKITQDGHSRRFGLTDLGWRFLAEKNYQKLRLLKMSREARRKKQWAVAQRKKRPKVYSDPTKQLIDDFRHGVEFERTGTLEQLRLDKNKIRSSTFGEEPLSRDRFRYVVFLLLAFEERKFCKLERIKWKIYHEFLLLPLYYRRFASFKGRPYVGFLDIKRCHPRFVGSLPCELFPTFYEFGEKLGWTLVYENDGVSIFADRNDKESASKLEQLIAFIQQKLVENSTAPTV